MESTGHKFIENRRKYCSVIIHVSQKEFSHEMHVVTDMGKVSLKFSDLLWS